MNKWIAITIGLVVMFFVVAVGLMAVAFIMMLSPQGGIYFSVPAELSPATVGQPYEYTFCTPQEVMTDALCGGSLDEATNPSGGSPPYTMHIGMNGGFAPAGLGLSLGGVLSGTPTREQTSVFDVCVEDQTGATACKSTRLAVTEPAIEPSVSIATTGCSIVSKINNNQNNIRRSASGTASGPEGARLTANFVVYSTAAAGGYNTDCGDWTKTGYLGCERQPGDPASTDWSFSIDQVYDGTDTLSVSLRSTDGDDSASREIGCPK